MFKIFTSGHEVMSRRNLPESKAESAQWPNKRNEIGNSENSPFRTSKSGDTTRVRSVCGRCRGVAERGTQPERQHLLIPASWCSCLCIIPSPGVWTGSSDSHLTSSTWQT